jgi:Tfp pilus assembly protein PilF
MEKRLIILLLILPFAVTLVCAQPGNKKVVVVASKPMTYADSATVKQLFFSALQQKMGGNYSQAADLFNKILDTDPSNDATLYELGKIKRSQNDEAAAQQLFEKAVTVNRDNKYYWLSLAESYEKNNDLRKRLLYSKALR